MKKKERERPNKNWKFSKWEKLCCFYIFNLSQEERLLFEHFLDS